MVKTSYFHGTGAQVPSLVEDVDRSHLLQLRVHLMQLKILQDPVQSNKYNVFKKKSVMNYCCQLYRHP